MRPTEKWAYSFDNEWYNSDSYDTPEAALTAAMAEAKKENENSGTSIKKVYVGRIMKFIPYVDADNVIENIQQQAYDEADEYSLDYLESITLEERRKLETMLTETFNKWANETKNNPNFFTIEETSEHPCT